MQASDLSPVPASLCLRQEVIRVPQSKCDGGGGGGGVRVTLVLPPLISQGDPLPAPWLRVQAQGTKRS